MAFVVIYDACVLYPAPLRDLLIRLARTGLVRAHWTELILDECFRNILENRPDLRPEALIRTRELMIKAVPDCLVITANLADFPADKLTPYGIEAIHLDDFVLDLLDLAPGAVASVVVDQAAGRRTRRGRSPTSSTRCASRASCARWRSCTMCSERWPTDHGFGSRSAV